MSDTSLIIRALNVNEVRDFARLQRIVFPNYNSSKLGQRFCEAMFTEYARREDTIGLGAWKGTQLVGLITACHRDIESEIQSGLMRQAMFAAMIRPHVLWQSDAIKRVLNWLPLRKSQSTKKEVSRDKTWIKFVTMGIHEDARRMGLMTRLTSAMYVEACERGCRHGEMTVFSTNAPQRRCVEKMGWVAGREPEREGSVWYTIDLPCNTEA